MTQNRIPWRKWRFELSRMFRGAGFSSKSIESMDWAEFKKLWSEGLGALDAFDEEMAAMQ